MKIKDQYGGCLNIYQGKNGYIFLNFGEGLTRLTLEQLRDLDLRKRITEINDFDYDDFLEAYWEGVWGAYDKNDLLIATSCSEKEAGVLAFKVKGTVKKVYAE